MGCLVPAHHLGADPAPLRHCQASLPRPRPHRRTIHPGPSRGIGSPTPGAPPHPAARCDERRQRVGQPSPVRLPQVDLVAPPSRLNATVSASGEPSKSSVTTTAMLGHDANFPRRLRRAQRDTPPERIRVHTQYRSPRHGCRSHPGRRQASGRRGVLAARCVTSNEPEMAHCPAVISSQFRVSTTQLDGPSSCVVES